MSYKRWLAVTAAALLLIGSLCGCGEKKPEYKENAGQVADDLSGVTGVTPGEQFTDRDMDTDYADTDTVAIRLQDNGTQAGNGVSVKANTITVREAGTYAVSGTLTNGRLIIEAGAEDKIHLVLEGASIACAGYGALYVRQADKVFITLAEGTENALSVTEASTAGVEDNIDGTLYSKDDLTFNGAGSLQVSGPGHGIVCKAGLAVTGGALTVAADGGHAIQCKTDARIAAGSFDLTAGKDGIHVENPDNTEEGYLYVEGGDFSVTAGGDGFAAATLLQVSGGTGILTCGGGAAAAPAHNDGMGMGGFGGWGGWYEDSATATEDTSSKGMKGGTGLLAEGGTWQLDVADDGLHSNGDLTVSGGTYTIATGDDGVHADGLTIIKDGTITITESYEGIEGNAVEIAGGTISVVASDDGVNAAGGNDQSGFGGGRPDQFTDSGSNSYIRISGGHLTVNASGDGIDANHSLYVEGGETYVSGPTSGGNGVLDYGVSASVTGGVFAATGTRDMAQGFTAAEGQGALLLTSSGSVSGEIRLLDRSGNLLLSWTPEKNYACIVLTCPDLQKGETYTLSVADTEQELELADWLYGTSSGMGGMGGGMGGGMQPPGGGGMGGGGRPGRW
ncbi:MAG: carbohydrate-binding domain-containing protein [Clostridia bacterium]|nr:carbohydrate-binding domain-containing protein [Clostridia bacterium]